MDKRQVKKICNLEREYSKSRRDKIGITRHNAPSDVYCAVIQMKRVTCTLYNTWCIMICLVIPILSLLLCVQSLYSLSKLQFFIYLYILEPGVMIPCVCVRVSVTKNFENSRKRAI